MEMKTFVHLNKIKIFARHGVLPQEQLTGAYFYVSLKIGYDFSEAMQTDNLAGTISYADFPQITSIELTIDKENPPMGAECLAAGIDIKIEY